MAQPRSQGSPLPTLRSAPRAGRREPWERGWSWHTYRFTVVIVSGRQHLLSGASAFSLTSFEA